jgi:hypothetical protein
MNNDAPLALSMSDFLVPDWTGISPNVGALSTQRKGGVSRAPYDDGSGAGGLNLGTHVGDRPEDVRQNRARLRALLPSEPAWLSQVHGATVVDAAMVSDAPPEADACISTVSGVVCAIQTADCLPVLFCDVGGKVVGAAHAGWRGLAAGVLENTLKRMRDAGAGDIVAWMGPAIGPERFEVGSDVLTAFAERDADMRQAFRPAAQPGKYLADIYSLARMVLSKAGVNQVFGGGLCTVSDARRFYSYRRDKTTGRMASLIWLK